MNDRLLPEEEEEQAVEQALGDNPRATELQELRHVLEERLKALQADLVATHEPEQRRALQAQVNELKRQIRVLKQEEAISDFVERSVRVSARRAALEEML
ncbi:MAG TPA: hypothetical protein VKV18_14735 [Chthonomonas sp.]|uniref:hypothetical protein n=1 Tax=Chthonomonas sp. TaxID=2282153 RepID=UPI002B4B837D|nr:hypothetical protein [Chthonomonas sp.]HLI49924.1 hypothetical protein [Chthonomonas sp.]